MGSDKQITEEGGDAQSVKVEVSGKQREKGGRRRSTAGDGRMAATV